MPDAGSAVSRERLSRSLPLASAFGFAESTRGSPFADFLDVNAIRASGSSKQTEEAHPAWAEQSEDIGADPFG